MAKKSMSEKLYKDSPEMSRDNDSGKMSVKKKSKDGDATAAEKESTRVSDGTAGMPIDERHAMERSDMMKRHEAEHEKLGTGERKDVHSRHAKEYAAMHSRHDKELGTQSEGSGGGKEKIKKVEKGDE